MGEILLWIRWGYCKVHIIFITVGLAIYSGSSVMSLELEHSLISASGPRLLVFEVAAEASGKRGWDAEPHTSPLEGANSLSHLSGLVKSPSARFANGEEKLLDCCRLPSSQKEQKSHWIYGILSSTLKPTLHLWVTQKFTWFGSDSPSSLLVSA